MTRAAKAVTLGLSLSVLLAAPATAGSHESFQDLTANLKSPNATTRRKAVAELGKSRRREAITPLAALVHDADVEVRREVVRSLRELRDVSAVAALVTALGDGDRNIREEVIGTLVEIYADTDRKGPIGRFLNTFSDEVDRSSVPPYRAVEPAVYEALARALRDEDRSIREEAAYALGILGGRSALRDLATTLQDPDPRVRGAAATAIGKLGAEEDGKALVPLLADESEGVQRRVLYALGVLRVKAAGPALRELYQANRRKELGLRVLATLSRIGDPAQTELFQQLVQDRDPEKKRLAVEGLGRIADASRLDAFKKDYQREKNAEVRLAYAFALARLGDRAFIDTLVLSLASRSLGRRSRDYILEMGREALGDLYPYLGDPDADVRAALCEIVGAIGDTSAIDRLTPLIGDPNSKVADRANRAVERLRRGGNRLVKASG
jgi:HEAT repeat protein